MNVTIMTFLKVIGAFLAIIVVLYLCIFLLMPVIPEDYRLCLLVFPPMVALPLGHALGAFFVQREIKKTRERIERFMEWWP